MGIAGALSAATRRWTARRNGLAVRCGLGGGGCGGVAGSGSAVEFGWPDWLKPPHQWCGRWFSRPSPRLRLWPSTDGGGPRMSRRRPAEQERMPTSRLSLKGRSGPLGASRPAVQLRLLRPPGLAGYDSHGLHRSTRLLVMALNSEYFRARAVSAAAARIRRAGFRSASTASR